MDEGFVNNEIGTLIKAISSITEMDEDALEETLPLLNEQMEKNYSPELKEQSINQLVKNLEDQRLNREEAKLALDAAMEAIKDMIDLDSFKPNQRKAAEMMLQPLIDTFEEALNRFHLYHFELPMKLEEGAKIPTYAHDTDACADLYALEDVKLNPESYGNKIRTGVSIQLPEGWLAMIFPRSSIGAKTTLRLSNSVGIIDSGYRGELGVLFDNTSNGYVDIHKGDRIAQLLVMPSYRFQPKVVDILEDSDRGAGGFGSTGA